MQFFTTAQIGETRSITPEGYLLCRDVPLAAVAPLHYGPRDLPEISADKRGPGGTIIVSRTEDELFSDRTVSSAEGKPTTIGHPAGGVFVGPNNWRQLSRGSIHNVRRGSAKFSDCLVADLLFTDADAIHAIQNEGLREVSMGYDASYEVVEPGHAIQRNILVNHVALVARGRAGPRCAVGDEDTSPMPNRFTETMRRLMGAKDDGEAGTILAEFERIEPKLPMPAAATTDAAPESPAMAQVTAALSGLAARFEAIEARLPAAPVLAPTTDAATPPAVPADAWQSALAAAEIIAPGVRLPTYDAAPDKTPTGLAACQRQALQHAYGTETGKAVIDANLFGLQPTFDAMGADAVAVVFGATANAIKARNNGGYAAALGGGEKPRTKPTLADYQAKIDATWAANPTGSANPHALPRH